MFNAEIKFVSKQRGAAEKLARAVWDYARALYRHGQIAYDHSISKSGNSIRLLCLLPENCSLENRFHDKRGRDELRRISKLTKGRPVVRIIGEADETPPACICRRRASIHLFTHMFDASSPTACSSCGRPVPLYRLGDLDISTHEALLDWQHAYQACDRLFLHSGFGEQWGYKQTSRLDSGLTVDGRELCKGLEAKLGLPSYYYLVRYWGQSDAIERRRKCPGCGGNWLLPEPQGIFAFNAGCCRASPLTFQIVQNRRAEILERKLKA